MYTAHPCINILVHMSTLTYSMLAHMSAQIHICIYNKFVHILYMLAHVLHMLAHTSCTCSHTCLVYAHIHVLYMLAHVFLTHVLYMLAHILYMLTHVLYMLAHVLYMLAHVTCVTCMFKARSERYLSFQEADRTKNGKQ